VSRNAALGFDAAASASPLSAFGPAAGLIAALKRVTIGRTTLEIQLAEGMALFGSDPNRSLDAAIALSTPRDHSGRRRTICCRATDAN
jgi:hypothetical protein